MDNRNSIKVIADAELASKIAEFQSDFNDRSMTRIPERYLRYISSCKGMLMFSVWECYIRARNQDVISGNVCSIEEFAELMQSHGHSAVYNREEEAWSLLVGKTYFKIYRSRKGEGRCIIYAKTPEFEWGPGGMYDDSVLDTSLTDVATLGEKMEELDAINTEIIANFDRETAYWKKMLLAKQRENMT